MTNQMLYTKNGLEVCTGYDRTLEYDGKVYLECKCGYVEWDSIVGAPAGEVPINSDLYVWTLWRSKDNEVLLHYRIIGDSPSPFSSNRIYVLVDGLYTKMISCEPFNVPTEVGKV